MKYFPFMYLFSWLMGNVYMLLIWIIAIDVFSVSIIFSFLLMLISLLTTIVQFILTKRLFYLLRGFIIMSKLKTKKPKPVENEIEVKKTKTPKPKYKYRDVESNR
jgi:hypothetical protein